MSPTAKTSGRPGIERSGSTTSRPPRPVGVPSIARQRVGGHARRPHRRARRDDRSVGEPHADLRRPRRRRSPRRTSTPRRSSVRRARLDDFGVNGVSRRSAISTSTMRASRTGSCGKSFASTRSYSSRSAPAISTPVGPPPHTTTSRAAVGHGGRIGSSSLEAVEHVGPQPQGVVEVLEREGVLDDPGHVEVVRHGAGGDHEHVVDEPRRRRRGRPGVRRGRSPSRGPCARRRCLAGGDRAGRSRGWRGRRSRSRGPAVATWYSSGWNVWKLLASTSVTSTGAPSRPRATARPPKPAPTTTTRVARTVGGRRHTPTVGSDPWPS